MSEWREPSADGASTLQVVTLEQFVSVEELGAEPLVGDADGAVIPEGGDVMFYGDGGAGKTTLVVDLACHLAAGDDWLGIPVKRRARVLLVENEGPRPLFRAKLRRKLDAWDGAPLEGSVEVLEHPWGRLNFADPEWRAALAATIQTSAVDVVAVGPVTRSGMNEAGTLQEVRDFMALTAVVREASGRRVAFVLVHHENKGGKVSGAWEAAGDTLFHVQAQGHGRVRLYVQKARWSSAHHATTLQLRWTDGEGFALEDASELDDATVGEQILAAIRANPGLGWTKVEEATPGVNRQRRRAIRDGLLSGGEIVNVVKGENGQQEALASCPERRRSALYPAGDPTIQNLRPASGADGAQTAPAREANLFSNLRPAPDPYKGAGGAVADSPPPLTGFEDFQPAELDPETL